MQVQGKKPMLAQQIAMHTITLLARSAWMCIFSSLSAWMSFQDKKKLCALTICSQCLHGSNIQIANRS